MQKQVFARQYTTSQTPKKSGSKILVAALVGAGIIGGISYNSSETKVLPVVKTIQEKVAAFKSSSFVTLTVSKLAEHTVRARIIRNKLSAFFYSWPKFNLSTTILVSLDSNFLKTKLLVSLSHLALSSSMLSKVVSPLFVPTLLSPSPK